MSQMSVVWMCVGVCVLECCWCVVGVCALPVNRWHLQRSNMFDIHWRAKHVAKWLTFCRLHNSNSNSNSNSNRRQQQQSQQPTATVPPPTSSAANSNRQLATGNKLANQIQYINWLHLLPIDWQMQISLVTRCRVQQVQHVRHKLANELTDYFGYFDIFFTFMFMDSNSNCWLIADNRQVLLLLLSLLSLPLI